METLQSIKTRSGSIGNLSKALGAIKMVSSVKLSKLLRMDYRGSVAEGNIHTMLSILIQKMRYDGIDCVGLQSNRAGATLIIILSSAQGFCGALNNLISNEYKKVIERTSLGAIVEVCGVKHKYFANGSRLQMQSLHDIDQSSRAIVNCIQYYISVKEISEVYIVHAEAKNSLVQRAKSYRLLPLDGEDNCNMFDSRDLGVCDDGHGIADNILVEGDCNRLYADLTNMYMAASIRSAVYKHVVAELSARVSCLDAAVSNADDIYESLVSKYNKTRQSKITQELTEIISSMECMQ